MKLAAFSLLTACVLLCAQQAHAQCSGVDVDLDGFDACVDCDDADSTIYPGAVDVCGDSIDNDCNGFADDTSATVAGGGVGTPIPDGPGTVGPAMVETTVALNATIADIDIRLDLQHSFMGDLQINLHHPDGTNVRLVSNYGGGGSGYVDTILDDEATTALSLGVPPFTGSYIPDVGLSAFDGKTTDGVWVLDILDTTSGATGMVMGWDLIFTIAGTADADADGSPACADCDDNDAARTPGASELCDGIDNDCDGIVPGDESDGDGDGVPACADCDDPAGGDEDGDGVGDICDLCLGTLIPEAAPSHNLKRGRWALIDGDTSFDTTACDAEHTDTNSFSSRSTGTWMCVLNYTLADTAGCSCTQIVGFLPTQNPANGSGSLSDNETRHGCKTKTMDAFISTYVP